MTIESKRELPPLIITEKFDNLFRDRVIDMISNKITNNPPAEGGLSEVIHQPIIEWKGQNLIGDEVVARMSVATYEKEKTRWGIVENLTGVSIRFGNEEAYTQISLDLTSNPQKVRVGREIYVGSVGSFTAWYLAICKALNFGMSATMIARSAHEANQIQGTFTLYDLQEIKYQKFCEQLSKRFFMDE